MFGKYLFGVLFKTYLKNFDIPLKKIQIYLNNKKLKTQKKINLEAYIA